MNDCSDIAYEIRNAPTEPFCDYRRCGIVEGQTNIATGLVNPEEMLGHCGVPKQIAIYLSNVGAISVATHLDRANVIAMLSSAGAIAQQLAVFIPTVRHVPPAMSRHPDRWNGTISGFAVAVATLSAFGKECTFREAVRGVCELPEAQFALS